MPSNSFEALGTKWWLRWEGPEGMGKKAFTTISEFENKYSRFKPDSLISILNKHKHLKSPPSELLDMLEYGLELYKLTEGTFDISVATELEHRGYDSNYSFRLSAQKEPKTSLGNLVDLISLSEDKIEIDPSLKLDLGGFGKGWLIDKVTRLFIDNGCDGIIVNAGGDMRISRQQKTTIALEHPTQAGMAVGELELKEAAVACTSANRRKWLDPTSGKELNHLVVKQKKQGAKSPSAKSILAVFTHSLTATDADALSTAVYVSQQASKIASELAGSYLIIYDDFSFTKHPDYPGKLFTN